MSAAELTVQLSGKPVRVRLHHDDEGALTGLTPLTSTGRPVHCWELALLLDRSSSAGLYDELSAAVCESLTAQVSQ